MSEENGKPKYVELLESFKTKIASAGPNIVDGVVKALTDAEIDKRTKAVIKGLELIQVADKEIKKIKPDVEHFDEGGAPVNTWYTKPQAETLKKAKKKKVELDEAINLALSNNPDFSKLNNLVK